MNKGLGNWIFNILKYFSISYALVGLVLWIIGLVYTDYTAIHIDKWMIGDDGSVGYQWEMHDKSWIYFDNYTFPLVVITLPIYMVIGSSVSDGSISFMLNDILMLYLVLTPAILIYSCVLLKNIISILKKDNRQKTE